VVEAVALNGAWGGDSRFYNRQQSPAPLREPFRCKSVASSRWWREVVAVKRRHA